MEYWLLGQYIVCVRYIILSEHLGETLGRNCRVPVDSCRYVTCASQPSSPISDTIISVVHGDNQ